MSFYNYDLNVYTDIFKRYAKSKAQIVAIFLSLVSSLVAVAHQAYSSIVAIPSDATKFDRTVDISAAVFSSVFSLIFAIFIFYTLYSAVRCAKGNFKALNSFKAYITINLAYMILTIAAIVLNLFSKTTDPVTMIFGVVIAVLAGLLAYKYYDGIRDTIEYGVNAACGNSYGQSSRFLRYITIIIIVLHLITLLAITFIYSFVSLEPTDTLTAADIAKFVKATKDSMIELLIHLPQTVSYILFLYVWKKFDKEMKLASK